MIKSKLISKYKNISHGFFNKLGGYSNGIYKSLNCGTGSKDNKSNINKNLKKVCKKIKCTKNNLVLLNQIHSKKVILIKKIPKKKPIGDALITSKSKCALGILTADCAPVFIFDPKKNIVSALHAGWKGALNGIVKNTVATFNKLNSNNGDLIAVVGPCIGKKNYKVKTDLYKKFIDKDKKNELFFEKISNENYVFNLRSYINKEISNLNIKNIENIEKDTFSEAELFYSYRRSRLNKEPDYGRCISVILMT